MAASGLGRRLLGAALLLIGLSGCTTINRIPVLDEQVKAAWSQVLNQYQRRTDLILTNPLIFDSNVNHEHLQEADVDSSFVAARAEPRKTETWPPTRGNDDTSPN